MNPRDSKGRFVPKRMQNLPGNTTPWIGAVVAGGLVLWMLWCVL